MKIRRTGKAPFRLGGLLQVMCLICFSSLLTMLPRPAFARTWNELIHGNVTYAPVNPPAQSDVWPAQTGNDGVAGHGNSEARENSVGIYFPDGFDVAREQAVAREASLGRKIEILSLYEAWGNERRPNIAGIEQCLQRGFVPMITWEPWRLPGQKSMPEKQEDYSLSVLLKGRYDGYIRQWALDLKQLSSPIFLRPMHEMNGNWYPWCGTVNGNKPEEYVAAWHHIRSIFREVGCDKVVWVWSPYSESVPNEAGNGFSQYFPGEEEVDCLALDGYNWGSTREWSRWQTFEEVFADGYDRLMRLAPRKPFMIAEAGCAEKGGDKSLWIEKAADALKNRFTTVKALVWFDVSKECDWRIESSRESLISFKTNFNGW